MVSGWHSTSLTCSCCKVLALSVVVEGLKGVGQSHKSVLKSWNMLAQTTCFIICMLIVILFCASLIEECILSVYSKQDIK